MSSTRTPYIPIPLNPLQPKNISIRRSSRYYPSFKRIRRNIATVSRLRPSYDLVMGETIQSNTDNELSYMAMPSGKPLEIASSDVPLEKVNNFIANLADNVKFSVPLDEVFDNTINSKRQQQGTMKIPAFHVTYWMFYPYSQVGEN